MSKLVLRPEDYEKAEALCGVKDSEELTILTHRVRGKFVRSIHVFERLPTQKELNEYEDVASKLKMKGRHTELTGSTILAASALYDKVISRVYDLPLGRKTVGDSDNGGPLDRKRAAEMVPPLVKRAAVRTLVGEVYDPSQVEDLEGVEPDMEEDTKK